MVDEGVALESTQNKIAPPVVVEGQGVENRQHKGVDVLESHNLGMKIGNGGTSYYMQALSSPVSSLNPSPSGRVGAMRS